MGKKERKQKKGRRHFTKESEKRGGIDGGKEPDVVTGLVYFGLKYCTDLIMIPERISILERNEKAFLVAIKATV